MFPPLTKMTAWLEDGLGARFEMVAPIRRAEPPHAIIRAVVQAIVQQRTLRFRYQPRRGAANEKLVSPHVIVHVVGRLHLRGWDHGRNAPRDYVLTRIMDVAEAEEVQRFVGQQHDSNWTEQVVLQVCLREGEEQDAVRPDYDLDTSGRGTRLVRKSHAPYLIDNGTLTTTTHFAPQSPFDFVDEPSNSTLWDGQQSACLLLDAQRPALSPCFAPATVGARCPESLRCRRRGGEPPPPRLADHLRAASDVGRIVEDRVPKQHNVVHAWISFARS
jgi:hypothetical protein